MNAIIPSDAILTNAQPCHSKPPPEPLYRGYFRLENGPLVFHGVAARSGFQDHGEGRHEGAKRARSDAAFHWQRSFLQSP